MKGIFVTGTDTGVGKTVVTGCLFRYLTQKGYSVITQKWVQTGSNSLLSSDIGIHFKISKRSLNQVKEYLPLILPNVFKTPASPHLASRLENKKIDPDKIKKSFRSLSKMFDFVIVEGTGGALVPINKNKLLIDIVKELKLPALIVAGNKLGAINHTLLAIESLNARKIKTLGLVFNNLWKQNSLILKDNPRIIKALTACEVLGNLEREPDYEKIYKKFIPIGNKILKRILKNG
ncbi:MAG: dethiobiotin synthase [Candidatus Omnitrophota bacterium]